MELSRFPSINRFTDLSTISSSGGMEYKKPNHSATRKWHQKSSASSVLPDFKAVARRYAPSKPIKGLAKKIKPLTLKEACLHGDIAQARLLLRKGASLPIEYLEEACQQDPHPTLSELFPYVTGMKVSENIHNFACRKAMPYLALHTFSSKEPNKINALIRASIDKLALFPLVLKLACMRNADKKICNKNGETVFMLACIKQSLPAIKLLMDHDKDNLFTQDPQGNTPLFHLCDPKNLEHASLIINRCLSQINNNLHLLKIVNAPNLSGQTPLYRAASKYNVKLIRELIQSEVQIDQLMSSGGERLLNWSIRNGYASLTLLILNNDVQLEGPEIDTAIAKQTDDDFKDNLLVAFNLLSPAEKNNPSILELLILLGMHDTVETITSEWENNPKKFSSLWPHIILRPIFTKYIVSTFCTENLQQIFAFIDVLKLPESIKLLLLPAFDPDTIKNLVHKISKDTKTKTLASTIDFTDDDDTQKISIQNALIRIKLNLVDSFINPELSESSEYYSQKTRELLKSIPFSALAFAVEKMPELFINFWPLLDNQQTSVMIPLFTREQFLTIIEKLPFETHKYYLPASTILQRLFYMGKTKVYSTTEIKEFEQRLILLKSAFDHWKQQNNLPRKEEFTLAQDQLAVCRQHHQDIRWLKTTYLKYKINFEKLVVNTKKSLRSFDMPDNFPDLIDAWGNRQKHCLETLERALNRIEFNFEPFIKLLPPEPVIEVSTVPEHLLDWCTGEIMTDPVEDNCLVRHVHEKGSLMIALESSHLCPIGKQVVNVSTLRPRDDIRSEIETYLNSQSNIGSSVSSTITSSTAV